MKPNLSFARTLSLLLAVMVLLAAACNRQQTDQATGPTQREVLERYRQPYAEMRARLKQIAQLLPPKGSVKDNPNETTSLNLNPAPTYKRAAMKGPVTDNTGVMAAEQLLDPEVTPEFDLALLGFPQSCFYWLSQKYASAADLNAPDDGSLAAGFEAGLARRYLLVYRTARYDRPTLVNETSFKPGAIDLELFLVDFQSPKILTSFRAAAKTGSEARVMEGGNALIQVEDTLRQNVRAVIADSFAKKSGGSLEYR